MIRFAIVGPGLVGAVHATALARIEDAELVAVVGASAASSRGRDLAERHGARFVPTLDALLAEPGFVDAVIVATPHPLHADAAIAALRAGVHAIVEKPLALTARDADAILSAAADSSATASVISQRRWHPATRRVRAAIDEGRIGRPAIATVELLGWRSPEYYAMAPWRGTLAGEGGGVLVNQAPHLLDLLCWFLGSPAEVDGFTANVNHPEIEVEDSALGIIRFAGGALASVVVSNAQRPGLHGRIHVHGSNGASVGLESDRGTSWVAGVSTPSESRNDVWTIPGEEEAPERWVREDRAALAGSDPDSHLHELQLRDIVAAIREGGQPPVDAREGRTTVALMEAIATASATGARVLLERDG